jgi:hypothetical protein
MARAAAFRGLSVIARDAASMPPAISFVAGSARESFRSACQRRTSAFCPRISASLGSRPSAPSIP